MEVPCRLDLDLVVAGTLQAIGLVPCLVLEEVQVASFQATLEVVASLRVALQAERGMSRRLVAD